MTLLHHTMCLKLVDVLLFFLGGVYIGMLIGLAFGARDERARIRRVLEEKLLNRSEPCQKNRP